MANKHAVLSASSSERWLNCPPSARLCENYEDKGSDYAAEGTDAHSLCEFRLKQALGMPTEDPIENLSWYNEEMEECAAGYAAYVVELLETAKQTCTDPVVMIEQRVNFSRWVQDGFGTADCIVIADGVMNICDYKYGKGVEVSAVANPQMMLYALGALEIFDDIYDIDTVRMTIFQPRKSNVSAYEMEKADLLQWADTELTQKAKLAYEGQGDFHCGEWCRFCKAKAECRERAEANMALARYDFQTPALLDDEEIADILGKVDALTAWASDVKEYALQQAISGKDWSGWKLVEGRSNRKYAMCSARWVQCEEMTNRMGFLSKHPTTGKPIPSPFINIGINYMNQAVRLWNEIFQIVKENCSTEYGESTPQDDLMERLLRARKG